MSAAVPDLAIGDILEIDDTWVFNTSSQGLRKSFRQNAVKVGRNWTPINASSNDTRLTDKFGQKARFIIISLNHEYGQTVGHGERSPDQDCLVLQPLNPDGTYNPKAQKYEACYNAEFPYYDGSLYKVNVVGKYQQTFAP